MYEKGVSINDVFGFFYCSIETPLDLYIGLLPVKNDKGIELPLGTWKGWYFSEELKFAQDNGYKITVLNGYSFNQVENTFKSYVSEIYKFKSDPNPNTKWQKPLAKSLLNNLLGRFGINIDKAITSIIDRKVFDEKSLIHKVYSYVELGNDFVMVRYSPKLDYDIIQGHKLDMFKVLSKYKDIETLGMDNTSVAISAAVNAYARIEINKIKLYILSKRGR